MTRGFPTRTEKLRYATDGADILSCMVCLSRCVWPHTPSQIGECIEVGHGLRTQDNNRSGPTGKNAPKGWRWGVRAPSQEGESRRRRHRNGPVCSLAKGTWG
jgi:hypothetical protein